MSNQLAAVNALVVLGRKADEVDAASKLALADGDGVLGAFRAEIQAPANEIDHWAQTNDFDFWIEVGVLTGPFAAWVSA